MSVGVGRYPVDSAQVEFFGRNGFLLVEGLFSSEECDRLRSICDSHGEEGFPNVLNLDRREPALRDVMLDPRAWSFLEAFQEGSEVVAVMTQVLFKKARSPYAAQAWNPHQDNSYPQAKAGAYMQFHLFLNDADKENGGLYVYPGSHEAGLLPFLPTVSYRERPGEQPGNKVEVPEKYRDRRTDVAVKKGAAMFIHGHVIHGSYPNVSRDRDRTVFSVAYLTRGESFLSGPTSDRTVVEVH